MTQRSICKKSFMGAAIGTMIEYYDCGLYLFFLPIISPVLFPSSSAYQALLNGYVILFLSLFFRPIGGIFFGYFGDFFGRKRALLMSMSGIAIATFAIGLIPAYARIGMWSLIAVTLAKAVQGFCFAGEYNGAGIYVVEHANARREAFIGSMLTATMLGGSLFAGLVGILLTMPHMPEWSWRIAFILGGCMGAFGIFYRKNMQESPDFIKANIKTQPLKHLFTDYPREFVAGVFIGGLATVPYTTVITFIMPVLMAKGFFGAQEFMLIQTILALFAMATLLMAGSIADKTTPAKTMILACCLLLILPYPLLITVDRQQYWLLIPALTVMIMLNEIFLAPAHAYLKKIFPMQYRYRGSSFSYNIGMSLFGGISPLIEHYLYQISGKFNSIALWIAFVSVCALLSIYIVETLPERSKLYVPETP